MDFNLEYDVNEIWEDDYATINTVVGNLTAVISCFLDNNPPVEEPKKKKRRTFKHNESFRCIMRARLPWSISLVSR